MSLLLVSRLCFLPYSVLLTLIFLFTAFSILPSKKYYHVSHFQLLINMFKLYPDWIPKTHRCLRELKTKLIPQQLKIKSEKEVHIDTGKWGDHRTSGSFTWSAPIVQESEQAWSERSFRMRVKNWMLKVEYYPLNKNILLGCYKYRWCN